MLKRSIRTALIAAICMAADQSSALASSYAAVPSERFVVDDTGKYIVPRSMNGDIFYLGAGVYQLHDFGSETDRFFGATGTEIKYKLPPDSQSAGAYVDPAKFNDFKSGPQTMYFGFTQNGKHGVCDRQGNVFIPAVFSDFLYLGENRFFTMSPNPGDFSIIGQHGKILYSLKGKGTTDDWHTCMMGSTSFSEGRLPLQHNFGGLCTLMDDQCKLITPEKYFLVGSFNRGKALVRMPGAKPGSVISAFINRNGETVKEFPADAGPEDPCVAGLYVYSILDKQKAKYGLINSDAAEIVKPVFDRVEQFAGKYFLGTYKDFGAFDVFDFTGKHLLHGDSGADLRTSADITSGKLEPSPLLKFLLKENGAAVAYQTKKGIDIPFNAGLLNSEGKWLIPPEHIANEVVARSGVQPPSYHHAFEYRPKAFTSVAWSRWRQFACFDLYDQFCYFLKQNNLIAMPLAKVKKLLGEPDSVEGGKLIYLLTKLEKGKNLTYLEIRSDAQQNADAWRWVGKHQKEDGTTEIFPGKWETSDLTPGIPAPNGGAGQLVPKTKSNISK